MGGHSPCRHPLAFLMARIIFKYLTGCLCHNTWLAMSFEKMRLLLGAVR
jgi:hypothetical protein